MTKEFKALALNLQLFAEGAAGGDGGTGAEGMADSGFATTDTKGVKNPLANVKYGKQEDVQTTDVQPTEAAGQAEDLNAKFEELINGEYKEQYAAKVKDTSSSILPVKTVSVVLFSSHSLNSMRAFSVHFWNTENGISFDAIGNCLMNKSYTTLNLIAPVPLPRESSASEQAHTSHSLIFLGSVIITTISAITANAKRIT